MNVINHLAPTENTLQSPSNMLKTTYSLLATEKQHSGNHLAQHSISKHASASILVCNKHIFTNQSKLKKKLSSNLHLCFLLNIVSIKNASKCGSKWVFSVQNPLTVQKLGFVFEGHLLPRLHKFNKKIIKSNKKELLWNYITI